MKRMKRGSSTEREGRAHSTECTVTLRFVLFFWYTHLGLFHAHLAFVSVAVETICDLPHPLPRTDSLYKVGREQSHFVPAFPLVNTHHR